MIRLDPSIYAYTDEFWGHDLIYRLVADILKFTQSDRRLPANGELRDLGDNFYWWIINHHSMLLYVDNPNTFIFCIVDSEVRGSEGIQYYLDKFKR